MTTPTQQDFQAALDALPIARFTDLRVDKFYETIRAALTQCAKECGVAVKELDEEERFQYQGFHQTKLLQAAKLYRIQQGD